MIDEKKIKEAAQGYCDATYGTLDTPSFILDGFKQGANWAQEEFKKSLWHDTSEEPEKNKLIIEEYLEEFGYNYEIDTYNNRTWVEIVKVYGIRKWCYLDDILPKKGGEK